MSCSNPPENAAPQPDEPPSADDLAIDAIRRALRGLRFGQVVIIVQDGVVVQIDRTERTRLRSKKS